MGFLICAQRCVVILYPSPHRLVVCGPLVMQGLLKRLDGTDLAMLPRLHKYIRYASALKNEILVTYPSDWNISTPPPFLPPAVSQFLGVTCGMDERTVCRCWKGVKEVVWSMCSAAFDEKVCLDEFRRLGAKHGWRTYLHWSGLDFHLKAVWYAVASTRNLWPPHLHCTNPDCTRTGKGRKLQTTKPQQAILYTVAHGPIPVYSMRLECSGELLCLAVFAFGHLLRFNRLSNNLSCRLQPFRWTAHILQLSE